MKIVSQKPPLKMYDRLAHRVARSSQATPAAVDKSSSASNTKIQTAPNREALRIEVDTSLPAVRVIRALNELVELRGAPLSIRLDNGPEFIAHVLAQWAQSKGIALNHIQPGKPTQNAYVERFNKTYRTEVLDCYVFDSLQEVRDMTADWLHRYNHHRPHESLGRVPPVEYRVKQFPNLYF